MFILKATVRRYLLAVLIILALSTMMFVSSSLKELHAFEVEYAVGPPVPSERIPEALFESSLSIYEDRVTATENALAEPGNPTHS